MAAVSEFARAKINLALHVLGRRTDGYHELDSIVAFADIGDTLMLEPSVSFEIVASGPFAAGLPPIRENIVYRAWQATGSLAPGLPPVRINLVKNLPVMAGIGGGSANAAAAIRALLRMAGVSPPADELRDLALSLGADVPVCLVQRPCRMRGIGERIDALRDFTPLNAVLVNPGVAVPTPEIFRAMGLERGATHGEPLNGMDVRVWRNDMTAAAVALAPVITNVLAAFEGLPGLVAARMSGSGATCFGVFETSAQARQSAVELRHLNPGWWIRDTVLGGG